MPFMYIWASYLPHRSALRLYLPPIALQQIELMCTLLALVSAVVIPVPKQIWPSDHSPPSPFPEREMYFKKFHFFTIYLDYLG